MQVDVDKVIERVNVLLHQSLHLEKRREKHPFVFDCLYGIAKPLARGFGFGNDTLHATGRVAPARHRRAPEAPPKNGTARDGSERRLAHDQRAGGSDARARHRVLGADW